MTLFHPSSYTPSISGIESTNMYANILDLYYECDKLLKSEIGASYPPKFISLSQLIVEPPSPTTYNVEGWIDSNSRATSPTTSQSSKDLVAQEAEKFQQNKDDRDELKDKDAVDKGCSDSGSRCGSTQESTDEIDFEVDSAELINQLYTYIYGGSF